MQLHSFIPSKMTLNGAFGVRHSGVVGRWSRGSGRAGGESAKRDGTAKWEYRVSKQAIEKKKTRRALDSSLEMDELHASRLMLTKTLEKNAGRLRDMLELQNRRQEE